MEKGLSKLHLGCGLKTPPGWIHCDNSWNARLARHPLLRRFLKTTRLFPRAVLNVAWNEQLLIHDVRKPLPFADNSLETIYSSNLLEHLYRTEAEAMLSECFRLLRPGGVCRIVVPDLRAMIQEYLDELSLDCEGNHTNGMKHADRLNVRMGFYPPAPPSGPLLYRLYKRFQSADHKWLYDERSLAEYFAKAGFTDVGRMPYQQSRIADIAEIEQTAHQPYGELAVEGVKPTS
jgi:SAM-dependent methyltransferase